LPIPREHSKLAALHVQESAKTVEWGSTSSTQERAVAKAEASVEELVGMIERGELRLPEMQRRYVGRSTRVRDLLDSLYRGYPSGAILLWETDEAVPLQEMAVAQQANPYPEHAPVARRPAALDITLGGDPRRVG